MCVRRLFLRCPGKLDVAYDGARGRSHIEIIYEILAGRAKIEGSTESGSRSLRPNTAAAGVRRGRVMKIRRPTVQTQFTQRLLKETPCTQSNNVLRADTYVRSSIFLRRFFHAGSGAGKEPKEMPFFSSKPLMTGRKRSLRFLARTKPMIEKHASNKSISQFNETRQRCTYPCH